MPELRELCLECIDLLEEQYEGTRRVVLGESCLLFLSSQDSEEQKAGQAGFVDSVLTGLAECRSLKVLKLVCLHDKVTLTR